MKKNFKYIVLSLLAVLGLASCSDEYQYSPAEAIATAQVYFPNTTFVFDVDDENGTVDVPVARVDASEAMNVKINVTKGDENVTFPQSVAFAAGEKEAKLQLDYANLAYFDTIFLSVELDAEVATPYGISSYDFGIARPAPWKKPVKVDVVDDAFAGLAGLAPVKCQMTIQENEVLKGYYRLVNPYGKDYPYNEEGDFDEKNDYYIYIHAEDPDFVYVEPQNTGCQWFTNGVFWVSDYAGYFISGGNPAEAVKKAGYGGKIVDGIMTWEGGDKQKWVIGFDGDMGYLGNGSLSMKIALPGYSIKDYAAEIEYEGTLTDKNGANYAVLNVELGEDAVNKAKAVVVTADLDADAVADAIAAGELTEADGVVTIENGRNNVKFDPKALDSNQLQVVVVVVDDNAVQNYVAEPFEFYGGAENPWVSIGIGEWTDDWVITQYAKDQEGTPFDPISYEVEVFEHKDQPGLYRVMDAYSNNVYPYAEDDCAKPGSFIVVNATDPQGVYIERQSLGFDWGDGEISIETFGAYYHRAFGYDYAMLKEYGYLGAVIDGVVRFPVFNDTDEETGETSTWQGITWFGEAGYDAGVSGKCKLVLPEAYKAGAKAKSTKKAAHFKKSTKKVKGTKVSKSAIKKYNFNLAKDALRIK